MNFDEAQHAIKRGDLDLLRAELQNGGLSSNLAHRFGATILAVAAGKGNTSIGKLLIENGAVLDQRDKHGNTPLASAVMAGQTSFVRLLLESGASLDCDRPGGSPTSFLDWVERYCGVSPEQMKNIRTLFESESRRREQAALA